MKNIYDIEIQTIDNKNIKLKEYENKFLLILNIARECGLKNQLFDLQNLYEKNKNKNFEILAFPCNDFNNQESGEIDDIIKIYKNEYKLTFPVFNKIEIKKSELFTHLTENLPGIFKTKNIKWNFTKFLVSDKGKVLVRFAPIDQIAKVEKKLKLYL